MVGGGYIGMEVAAAAVGWKLDTTVSICCIVPRKKDVLTGFVNRIIILGALVNCTSRECTTHPYIRYE